MGGLIGGGGGSGASIERLAGVDVSTSVYGAAIPVVFGTARIATNLGDYDDFRSEEQKSSSGSGKGGGSQTTGYKYFANIISFLCRGEIQGIGRIWNDKDVKEAEELGLTLFSGAESQAPWAVWQTMHPEKALAYSGIAYLAGVNFALGSSGGMPNLNVEVMGLHSDDTEVGDAWPHNVIYSILCDTRHGLGVDPALIADLEASQAGFAAYCKANSLAVSPAYTEQSELAEIIGEICEATNSEPIIRAGARSSVLDFMPLDPAPASGNGATYTPNVRPVVDIYFEDLLNVVDESGVPTGDDGIEIELIPEPDVRNVFPIEFLDAENEFNSSTAQEPDDGDCAEYGEKFEGSKKLELIHNAAHASKVSKFKAARAVHVRGKYTFELKLYFFFLEPGDLITLTSAHHGMDHVPLLIRSATEPAMMEHGQTQTAGVVIEAEDWIGVPGATIYARGGSAHGGDASQPPPALAGADGGGAGGSAPGQSIAPGPAQVPLVFEPPPRLTGGARQLWLATTGGQNWGGATVHVSVDGGESYSQIGRVTGRCRYGATSASTSAGAGATIAVQLSGYVADGLAGVSQAGLDSDATLSWLGGEVVGYRDATLTGANAYALTTLRRGLKGTTDQAHASGAAFARLDDSIFKYDIPSGVTEIKIKLQSYNVFGNGAEDISGVAEYSYTIGGQSWPIPSGTTLSFTTSPPAVDSGTAFAKAETWNSAVRYNSGNPRISDAIYADIGWQWTGEDPDRFEVAIISGSDPDNLSSHIIRPIFVRGSCRRAVVALWPDSAISDIRASVKAVYYE
jgi:hypothetical protein